MGNILIDNNGNALLSGNKALEVTASIDSNIVAGNIKKDVTILGVTGTYEGNGGTNFTFLDCVVGTTSKGGSNTKAPDPGTANFRCYVDYSSISNNETPIGFVVHQHGTVWTGIPSTFIIDDKTGYTYSGQSFTFYNYPTNTTASFYVYGAKQDYGTIQVAPIFPSMLNIPD